MKRTDDGSVPGDDRKGEELPYERGQSGIFQDRAIHSSSYPPARDSSASGTNLRTRAGRYNKEV
jgi:hypothetical protein